MTDLVPIGAIGTRMANRELVVTTNISDSVFGAILVSVAMIAGLIAAGRTSIKPIETRAWSVTNAWSGMRRWSRTAALGGLYYGAYFGLAVGLLYGMIFVFVDPWRQSSSVWQRSGLIAGTIAGLLLGVALALVPRRSAGVHGGIRPRLTPKGTDALLSGLLFSVASTTRQDLAGIIDGLGVAIAVGASRAISARAAAQFSGSLVGGLIGASGVIWVLARASHTSVMTWARVWLVVGVGAGTIIGVIAWLTTALKKGPRRAEANESGVWQQLSVRKWRWWVISGVATALISGLAFAWLGRIGHMPQVRGAALAAIGAQMALDYLLRVFVFFACSIGVFGALAGGFMGALFGALNGLTGPDVQRRSVPNQGIHQSAANVGMFALLGMLTVGVPYALLNLMSGALLTGTMPNASDWVRLGLGSALMFGLLGGLIPGAACLQHFTLRFVLWCYGAMPWRYVRFLNHGTERMLLQRVGGRYRFLHIVLRDRFAELADSPGRAS